MSGSIREPSFEAKMLREAIEDEVEYLRLYAEPLKDALAEILESVGNRFMGKVYVKD